MVIKIDKHKITEIIVEKRPKRIVFNAPDGLLSQTRELASELETEYDLDSIIISDPTYGSCDTVDLEAKRLGADLAFHIGHNVRVKKFGSITYYIDASDDLKFNECLLIAEELLKAKSFKSIGLVAFAQHIDEISSVAQILAAHGFDPIIGKGMGQLHDGQIFGCEFYPAFNIRERVDAMLLLGQSMFHAIGLCLSSGRPTFMLDPHLNEVVDVQQVADDRLKRAILSVYKARDADRFGLIIGLKEGQIMVDQSIQIKQRLEKLGKKVQLFALREITSDRINSMSNIDAFVQTGCPRKSDYGYTFSKPVLSEPQSDALINLLSGKDIQMDIFQRKNWL